MGKRRKRDNIIVQGSILVAASIFVRIIGLVYRIPLVNILGNEGMGVYSQAFEVYQILLLISSYSLPLAVSKLVSARVVVGEHKNVHRIFQGALIFAAGVGLVVGTFTFFASNWLSRLCFGYEDTAPALKVLAPTIMIVAVMGVFRGFFQGKNSMLPTAVSQIIEQIFNAIVSVLAAFILVKNGAAYGAAGGTLGTCLGALSGLIFLVFVYYLYRPIIRKLMDKDKTKEVMPYSHISKLIVMIVAPVILSSAIYQLSNILDSIIFSKSTVALGYDTKLVQSLYGIYSGKYKTLINIPLAVATALAAALIPSVTAARTLHRNDVVGDKINLTLRFNMLISMPCMVGLMVLSSPILQMLFHDTSTTSARLLMLGSLNIAVFSTSTVSNAILQGINRMKLPVIHAAISLGIYVVFAIVLVRFCDLNVFGLVYANLVFGFCMCLLNAFAIKREVNMQQSFLKTYILPLAASVIMGAVAFFIYKGLYFLIHSNTLATLIAIIAGVIVYGIAILLMGGISEEELYTLPKGRTVAALFRKMHLL